MNHQISRGLWRPLSGSVAVLSTDPAIDELEFWRWVRVDYRGRHFGTFVVENLSDENHDDGRVRIASGRGLITLLDRALVWPDASSVGTNREFTGTPAAILRTLISEAQERGTLPEYVVTTFTDERDSVGKAFGDSVTYRLRIGTSLLDYVRAQWERGIWIYTRVNWEQHLVEINWVEPPYGRDLTSTVVLRLNEESVTERIDSQDFATVLLAHHDDTWLEVVDDDSVAQYGRVEQVFEAFRAGTNAGAADLAREALQSRRRPAYSIEVKLVDVDDTPRVGVEYDLGDVISIITTNGTRKSYRVVGYTLDFQDTGRAEVTLELEREPSDFVLAQKRWVQRASRGLQSELAQQDDVQRNVNAHNTDALAHRNLEIDGDVTGTPAGTTVVALRGTPIDEAPPFDDAILKYDASAGKLKYVADTSGDALPLGGDLSGTTDNATVVGIQGRTVDSTPPLVGQAYRWDGHVWKPRDDPEETDPVYVAEKPTLWTKVENIRLYAGDEATALQRKIASTAPLLDGFDSDTLDSAWSWAGAPFVVLPQANDNSTGTYGLQYESILHTVLASSSGRAFVYRADAPASGKVQGTFGFATMCIGASVGIRYDDGSDNNYAEAGIEVTGAAAFKIVLRERKGGGTVGTTYGNEITLPLAVIVKLVAAGTLWSSWHAKVWFTLPYNMPLMAQFLAVATSTTHDWTPQRYGLFFRPPTGAGNAFLACDDVVIVV